MLELSEEVNMKHSVKIYSLEYCAFSFGVYKIVGIKMQLRTVFVYFHISIWRHPVCFFCSVMGSIQVCFVNRLHWSIRTLCPSVSDVDVHQFLARQSVRSCSTSAP